MSVLSRILLVIALLSLAGCTGGQPASPPQALSSYQEVLNAKDTTTMKLLPSAHSIKMLEQEAKAQGVTVDDVVKRETLFDDDQKAVEFRNEKIDGAKATLELKNAYGTWETIPFVLENGEWKIDKKGYADRLMQDIQDTNDQQLDQIINQGKDPN